MVHVCYTRVWPAQNDNGEICSKHLPHLLCSKLPWNHRFRHLNYPFESRAGLCFPNFPEAVLRILTAGCTNKRIIHRNIPKIFNEQPQHWNSWRNLAMRNTSMKNRHIVLLSEMERANELGGILNETVAIAGRLGEEKRLYENEAYLSHEKRNQSEMRKNP